APPEDDPSGCRRAAYEGETIAPDPRVAALIAPAMAGAAVTRGELLGVTLAEAIEADRSAECALGNLFTDLMLEAHPGADAAIINGGGLRADLPAGPLRYGALYQAMPFDNRYAVVRMTGRELSSILGQIAGR